MINTAKYHADISVSEIVEGLFSQLTWCAKEDIPALSRGMCNAAVDYLESKMKENENPITRNSSSVSGGNVVMVHGFYSSGVQVSCALHYSSNQGLLDEVAIALSSDKPLDSYIEHVRQDLRQACRVYACQAKEKIEPGQ